MEITSDSITFLITISTIVVGIVINFTRTESKTKSNAEGISVNSKTLKEVTDRLEENKLNDELRNQKLITVEAEQKEMKKFYGKFTTMEKDILKMQGDNSKELSLVLQKLDQIIEHNTNQTQTQIDLEHRVSKLEIKTR